MFRSRSQVEKPLSESSATGALSPGGVGGGAGVGVGGGLSAGRSLCRLDQLESPSAEGPGARGWVRALISRFQEPSNQ